MNTVLPGAIDTPMLRDALDKNDYIEADVAPAISLFGRFNQLKEVAEASARLCSDAASYIAGRSLAVELEIS